MQTTRCRLARSMQQRKSNYVQQRQGNGCRRGGLQRCVGRPWLVGSWVLLCLPRRCCDDGVLIWPSSSLLPGRRPVSGPGNEPPTAAK